MNRKRQLSTLSKLLRTLLRQSPEAYGLVPDRDRWVPLKDLLKALNELDEGRRLRRPDIDELLLSFPGSGIEVDGNRIRTTEGRPEAPKPSAALPKLLYTAVRRQAHRTVFENGIRRSAPAQPILLAADLSMAERLGRRKDAEPVVVTVNVRQALEAGVALAPAGEGLFTADRLPRSCLMVPALPKERPERNQAPIEPEPAAPAPGSYLPDPHRWATPNPAVSKRYRQRGEPEWKEARRRHKRR